MADRFNCYWQTKDKLVNVAALNGGRLLFNFNRMISYFLRRLLL